MHLIHRCNHLWNGKKVRKRHPNISETRGKLVALIEHMDDGVGRVINSLEKSGQLDNTLIIFVRIMGETGNRKQITAL